MTPPDANTGLILLVQSCTWLVLWFRKDRKAAKMEQRILDEHRMMYADYKILHDIKENGGVR